jgi:hypothetical protein
VLWVTAQNEIQFLNLAKFKVEFETTTGFESGAPEGSSDEKKR